MTMPFSFAVPPSRSCSSLVRRSSTLERGSVVPKDDDKDKKTVHHSIQESDVLDRDDKKEQQNIGRSTGGSLADSWPWPWRQQAPPKPSVVPSHGKHYRNNSAHGSPTSVMCALDDSTNNTSMTSFDSETTSPSSSSGSLQDLETGISWTRSSNSSNPKTTTTTTTTGSPPPLEAHLNQFMSRRIMTPTQERCNALTMLPMSLYCLVHLLSWAWITPAAWQHANTTMNPSAVVPSAPSYLHNDGDSTIRENNPFFLNHHHDQVLHHWIFHDVARWWSPPSGCWSSSLLPAIPPLPVLATMFAMWLHMPFSFLYHWKYAHELDPVARMYHWTRRMDHGMMHFCSILFAYGTSGSIDYALLAAVFNLPCFFLQFRPQIRRPRNNHICIVLAIVSYSVPLAWESQTTTLVAFWSLILVALWLFARYPLGGWSHAAFHVVAGGTAPLLMNVAVHLPISQPQVEFAAHCAVYCQQQQEQQLLEAQQAF